MARKRHINPSEARLVLGILMSAAFDPTTKVINLARSAEVMNDQTGCKRFDASSGQTQLLDLAYTLVEGRTTVSLKRQSEMLLEWVNRWLQPDDWNRLQAKLRKRRQYLNQKLENI